MTREEQIINAGKTAADGKEFSVLVNRQHRTMSAYEIGFIEGAEWADQHPNWIPVEDELPKENGCYLCYNCVEDEYEILFLGGGDWWDGDGHCVTNVVTHWMPLPEAPRKEDEK